MSLLEGILSQLIDSGFSARIKENPLAPREAFEQSFSFTILVNWKKVSFVRSVVWIWKVCILLESGFKKEVHQFLPECTAFNQSALRHILPECIASRTSHHLLVWIPVRKVKWWSCFALICLQKDVKEIVLDFHNFWVCSLFLKSENSDD